MFADQLTKRISATSSLLCAGFDPTLEWLPEFARTEALQRTSQEDFLYTLLMTTFEGALEVLSDSVACVKPNAAFFEQFGVGGYRALRDLSYLCRGAELPVILDAKRGDIGSTAQAYANAYLDPIVIDGSLTEIIHADALTVNPFLGFDTLAPFVASCVAHGKGLFVLVKTSNPGSGDIQNLPGAGGQETIAEMIARIVDREGKGTVGQSGLSSIGAVVGATYPEEAKRLRALMPRAIFLVPGFGTQGGSAAEAVTALVAPRKGVIVNMSRGLFHIDRRLPRSTWMEELSRRVTDANRQLREAADAHG